jgi:hypothetical protein
MTSLDDVPQDYAAAVQADADELERRLTPGLPDPALVVGDWTGDAAAQVERDAKAFQDLRDRIRRVTVHLLRERDRWATSKAECAVARAVAYQSAAGSLIRALDAGDQVASRG